eukprot:35139-Chlamydomonas_euryale.AAC.3
MSVVLGVSLGASHPVVAARPRRPRPATQLREAKCRIVGLFTAVCQNMLPACQCGASDLRPAGHAYLSQMQTLLLCPLPTHRHHYVCTNVLRYIVEASGVVLVHDTK